VIDEEMKREMINQGFDSKKLIITGSPFFDTIPSLIKTGQKEEIISFFCQPLSELFNRTSEGYLGYDEVQVFKDLVESLEKMKVKLPIIIKFHPRAEKLSKFDKIIKNSKIKILIEKKLPAEALIEKSKLVVGMNSVVLFQAAIMGKPVLSYQPNLKRPDPLMSNRLKISTAVYEKKSLYPALEKLLSGKNKKKNYPLIGKYTKNKSTKKIIDFIENIIKK
jgi:UDP-N-acetylglucosamine 2-epimerase